MKELIDLIASHQDLSDVAKQRLIAMALLLEAIERNVAMKEKGQA